MPTGIYITTSSVPGAPDLAAVDILATSIGCWSRMRRRAVAPDVEWTRSARRTPALAMTADGGIIEGRRAADARALAGAGIGEAMSSPANTAWIRVLCNGALWSAAHHIQLDQRVAITFCGSSTTPKQSGGSRARRAPWQLQLAASTCEATTDVEN